MAKAFGSLPLMVQLKPTPFEVDIPQVELEELKTLLKLSRLGPETFENKQQDGQFGITRDWLANAKAEWEETFDWRKTETRMNTVPNYTTPIKHEGTEYRIHFTALFSKNPNAVPLLLLHGWPGNFMEFLPIMEILMTRYTLEKLPYHIIVPSLPGYAFSSPPPLDRDFQLQDIAAIMHELMSGLGFGDGFVVQGGDIGSKVARVMGATYEAVKAVHINFCIMPRPEGVDDSTLSEGERKGLERTEQFARLGSAYALLHATKPSTIGLVLAANPLSLLAWIGEKFLAWTDTTPTTDEILSNVTLYWLTNTFATSIYPYRQLFTPGVIGAHENPKWHLHKPLGFSWFPKELAPIPRSWVETTGQLVWYKEHQSGGHFAAMERPETLLGDIEDFVAQVWTGK